MMLGKCSYCGKEIPIGKGFIFVKNNGVVYYYCSKKCYIYHQIRRKDKRKVKLIVKRK